MTTRNPTGFWSVVITASVAAVAAVVDVFIALGSSRITVVHRTTVTPTTTQVVPAPTPTAPAGPSTASQSPTLVWRAVDQNIWATQSASSKFAENVFWVCWHDAKYGVFSRPPNSEKDQVSRSSSTR